MTAIREGWFKPTFMECDTCASSPGTPMLCQGCLHNRALVSFLKTTGREYHEDEVSFRVHLVETFGRRR